MAFVPFEKLSYVTKLKKEEITKRIKKNIEPQNSYRFFGKKSDKPYEGKLYDNIFKLSKEVSFVNLFTPVVYGAIIEEDNKIKIRLKFTLHFIVRIVMIIWLLAVIIFFFNGLKELIINHTKSDNLFAAFGMLIIGYVIMTGAFKSESKKVKEDLEELFEMELEK